MVRSGHTGIGFGPGGRMTAMEAVDAVIKETTLIAVPAVEHWLILHAPEDFKNVRPGSLVNTHLANLHANAPNDEVNINPAASHAQWVNMMPPHPRWGSPVTFQKKGAKPHYQDAYNAFVQFNWQYWADAARRRVMDR